MKTIYLDNASTTMPFNTAIEPFLNYDNYYNPSALYNNSLDCKSKIKKVREDIKLGLNAIKGNIYFTSGGTESNNWIINTKVNSYYDVFKVPAHIITTTIEHHSVLLTLKKLEEQNKVNVTYLPVNHNGKINLQELNNCIQENTILITIIALNNEIGIIQDLEEIGRIAKEHSIPFHVDAVQAIGKIPIDIENYNISYLSLSAHKFHGPKGIGALYSKDSLPSFITGGSQELGSRAGTENIPAIIGMGNAFNEVANMKYISKSCRHYSNLHYIFRIELTKFFKTEDYIFNSHYDITPILNFCLKNVSGESLTVMLANENICISNGSACDTGNLEPSHVLQAINCPQKYINGAIRLSFSLETTEEEIKTFIQKLGKIYYRDE